MSTFLAIQGSANPPGASTPPIPSLTNIAALYSSYGIAAGWQNGNPLVEGENGGGYGSTADAPYPLNWAAVDAGADLINPAWYDQSGGSFDAATGGVPPHIITSSQRFTYDGTQNLATPTGIISGDKLTIYCVFSTNTLAAAQTLLQSRYTTDYVTEASRLFAVYLTAAGVLTVSQKENDGTTFNSKVKTLGDSNLHLLTVVFDRTISGADATVMKVDNSTSGVTSVATGTMGGDFGDYEIGIGLGYPLHVGDDFLDGTCETVIIFNAAHDNIAQTAWYNYLSYIYPDIP